MDFDGFHDSEEMAQWNHWFKECGKVSVTITDNSDGTQEFVWRFYRNRSFGFTAFKKRKSEL